MNRPTREEILIAAAKIGCCPAVAEKILTHGADAARNRVHRERAHALLDERRATPSNPPRSAA